MLDVREPHTIIIQMNKQELTQCCIEVGRLVSKSHGHYGNIVFPQQRSNRPVVREPEIRDVFGRYLMLEMVFYGIEVPTKLKYGFKGVGKTAARTDLAIFSSLQDGIDNKPLINIEFKEGQPTVNQIEKDWQKLIAEPVNGICFFHVLQNCNSRTIQRLLDKYEDAYKKALSKPQNTIKDKWLIIFLLILFKQKYVTVAFDAIQSISFDKLRKAALIGL